MGCKNIIFLARELSNLKTRGKRILFTLFFLLLGGCGTNTEVTQSPFVFLTPVAVPQIFSITAMYDNWTDHRPEYGLKYYVTNLEPQFVGYNLYITFAIPSAGETTTSSNLYLENGVQPSFPQLAVEASTANTVSRTIVNYQPYSPVQMFQKCEVYTFTLRALLNTGITSNMSAPVTRCSSVYPDHCASDTSCNPSACTTASCSAATQALCPVGTVCNPCTKGVAATGCACPTGQSPPGCNL